MELDCKAAMPHTEFRNIFNNPLSIQMHYTVQFSSNQLQAVRSGGFQPASGVFNHFYNGINLGPEKQASDAYCWIVSVLFGAWVFYGYDASVHLAEETKQASEVVAKGMWRATLSAWLMSIPTLIIMLVGFYFLSILHFSQLGSSFSKINHQFVFFFSGKALKAAKYYLLHDANW
jgi:amino acid transporter